MSRHRQNGLLFVPKKILTWVPREARGGLKINSKTGKRVTTSLSLYPHSDLLLSVSFSCSFMKTNQREIKAHQNT